TLFLCSVRSAWVMGGNPKTRPPFPPSQPAWTRSPHAERSVRLPPSVLHRGVHAADRVPHISNLAGATLGSFIQWVTSGRAVLRSYKGFGSGHKTSGADNFRPTNVVKNLEERSACANCQTERGVSMSRNFQRAKRPRESRGFVDEVIFAPAAIFRRV